MVKTCLNLNQSRCPCLPLLSRVSSHWKTITVSVARQYDALGYRRYGARSSLAHGVARLYADRFVIGGATAVGLVAFGIMFGMCGARLNFAIS